MRYSPQKQAVSKRNPDLSDLLVGFDDQLSSQLRQNLASGQTLYQAFIGLVHENRMSIGELKSYTAAIRAGRYTLIDILPNAEEIDGVSSRLQNVEQTLGLVEDLSVFESRYEHLRKKELVQYEDNFKVYAGGITELRSFGVEVHGKKRNHLPPFIVNDALNQYDEILSIFEKAKEEILSIENPELQNPDLVYKRAVDLITAHDKYIDASLRKEMMRQRSNALDLSDLLEIIMPAPLLQNSDTPRPKFRQDGYVDKTTLKRSYRLTERFLLAAEKLENHNIVFEYKAYEIDRLDMIISSIGEIREGIEEKVQARESRKNHEGGLDERIWRGTNIIHGHLERLEFALKSARRDVRRYLNLEEIRDMFNMLLEQNKVSIKGFDLGSYESHFFSREITGSNHAGHIRGYMRRIVGLAQQGMDSIAVEGSYDSYMNTLLQMRKIELGMINKHLEIMKLQEDARDIREKIGLRVSKYRMGVNDRRGLQKLHELKRQYRSLHNRILSEERLLLGSQGRPRKKKRGIVKMIIGFFCGSKTSQYQLRPAA